MQDKHSGVIESNDLKESAPIHIGGRRFSAPRDEGMVSPEIWLHLQSDYAIRIAQRTIWPQIEPLVRAHAA